MMAALFHLDIKRLLMPCLLLFTAQLTADELDDRLGKIREVSTTLLEKGKASPNPDESRRDASEIAVLQQFLSRVTATNNSDSPFAASRPENIAQQIDELRKRPGMPGELKSLLDELAVDLPKLLSLRTQRLSDESNRLVQSAASLCLTAKTEGELDPLLLELSNALREFRPQSQSGEPEKRAYRRLQAASETVSKWQDYLAQLSLGNTEAATKALQRFIDPGEYQIIARAEIEKRLASRILKRDFRVEQLDKLRGVAKMEDLESAIEEARRLAALEKNQPGFDPLQPFERLLAAFAALRSGFVGEAFQATTGTYVTQSSNLVPEWQAQLNRLRGLLLIQVLPRYLELRDIPMPNEGEGASDYLLRLTDEFVNQRRFAEASRVLETYRVVAFSGSQQIPSWIQADIEGLRSFTAAERLVEARSWAEAINSFRKAAETAGKFTPTGEAAKRLAELNQAHPEAVKTAAQLAESEAFYQRISRDIANDAARALEGRMPPDIRARMTRPTPYP